MFELQSALLGVLLPGFIVGFGLVLVWRPWTRRHDPGDLSWVALLFSLAFLRPWGGPVLQTYLCAAVVLCLSPLIAPLLIFAARAFREDSPRSLFARAWPWCFLPLGFMYLGGIFGVPLLGVESNLADPIHAPQ